MNKTELINKIAAEAGLSKADAKKALDATVTAIKDALAKGGSVLLEPIMSLEVVVPEEYTGDVMGDISSRRGRIEGFDSRNSTQIIKGFVPLANMFGYMTDLRSKTQGRGAFTMQISHYEQVPQSIVEKLFPKK